MKMRFRERWTACGLLFVTLTLPAIPPRVMAAEPPGSYAGIGQKLGPGNLKIVDQSHWESPLRFRPVITFSWQNFGPADIVTIDGFFQERFNVVPGSAAGPFARSVRDQLAGGTLRICTYKITKPAQTRPRYFPADTQRVGCVVGEVPKIQYPVPRMPQVERLSWSDPTTVVMFWHGDNMTESYEVERLQRPIGQSHVVVPPGSLSGVTGAAAGTGKTSVSTALAPSKQGRIGGSHSPKAVENSASTSPPYWARVSVQAPEKVLGDDSNVPPFSFETSGGWTDVLQTNIPKLRAAGIALVEPVTYRVCAINRSGRTCTQPLVVGKGAAITVNLPTTKSKNAAARVAQ